MTAASIAPATTPVVLGRAVDPRWITTLTALVGLFLLAFSTAFPDLGWLLWGGEVALSGGKLYRDFVEVNPPMIMLLNMIPRAVSDATGISDLLMYDLFILVTLVSSLWVTRRIYRGTEINGEGPVWEWVLPVLVFGFGIIAPSFRAWGQREMITAMLVLPYLALALERGHRRVPGTALVVIAALLCAVGISIKPHFLLPLAAVEGFVISRTGGFRALLRVELIIVGSLLTGYLLLSMVLWPEYFRFMRDLGGADAYAVFLEGQLRVLLHLGTVYGVMAILVSLSVPARPAWRPLRTLLMLVVAGFLLAALAQQKGFDYHLLPTMVFATALFALTFAERSARRPLVLIATAIAMFGMTLKIGSRCFRTLRMVASAPGTQLTEVIDVIRQYAPRGAPIMALSLHAGPFFPAVNNTGTRWASAFPTLSPLVRAYGDQQYSDDPIRYHRPPEMGSLERYMFDRMISDMISRRPALIILRRSLTDELFGDGRFNYIRYFSQDDRFRRFLGDYAVLPIEGNFTYYAPASVAAQSVKAPVARARFRTRWSPVCYNCLE